MVNVYVCNSWYLPKRWAVFRAHIPLAAIKRIRRSKIKQEYITSSWLGFVVFTTRDNFAGYKTPFYYKLYIKIGCMKLLFANRKDTNIKYWMRHKNKTDFFSLHANFRLVNKMVFLFNSPFIYMYIYKHIYIKELFIMLMWIVFTTHKNERRSLFVNKYIGCFFKYSIHLNVVAFLFSLGLILYWMGLICVHVYVLIAVSDLILYTWKTLFSLL